MKKKLQDECITILYDEKPGINLENGEVISIVRNRHTNDEFIEWLKIVDEKYDKSKRIIVVLDNHSVHRLAKQTNFLKQEKKDLNLYSHLNMASG